LDVLLKMGADIKVHNQHLSSGETIGDLEINSSQLKNISIEGDVIPRLIDEIPILALAAVFADGDFIVSDARELRFKETDRIKSICLELHKMGVDIVEKDDGFVVRGLGTKGTISIQAHSVLKSYGDHRMAMMEIIAGLKMTTTAKIDDVSCVQTSFPQFFELLESIS